MLDRDLAFISGKFFEFELPKEKNFLFKYFRSDLEDCFLRYYFCFGGYNHKEFVDHTGYYCLPRWLQRLELRLNYLLEAHQKAKQEMDLENLRKIESGECKGVYGLDK